MKKYVYDTNAILLHSHLLDLEGEKILPYIVLHELDRLKVGFNETAFNAREAVRKLKKRTDVTFDSNFDKNHPLIIMGGNNDDCIVACAVDNKATLITGDFIVELKAKAHGIEVYSFDDQSEDYSGYKEVLLNEPEIAAIYENMKDNIFNLETNEYLIVKNTDGELIDSFRWTGDLLAYAHPKGLKTQHFGQFKPKDVYQVCALDSLMSNQMTMLKGKAGSGKSLIALNYAWSQIEKGKHSKLIIFTNPVNARNSSKLGFYPGTRTEKLLGTTIGSMLSSKFGSVGYVESLIEANKIEILPFADIRGWDSTGMNAIIYFAEAQNLDVELMKLGIQRCSEDSKVILDGDYYAQVDSDLFAGMNNGMRRVSEIYRGEEYYGEVYLPNIYRSRMADRAQML